MPEGEVQHAEVPLQLLIVVPDTADEAAVAMVAEVEAEVGEEAEVEGRGGGTGMPMK
jgi:hypothetical protein